jgi:hypothetical protein
MCKLNGHDKIVVMVHEAQNQGAALGILMGVPWDGIDNGVTESPSHLSGQVAKKYIDTMWLEACGHDKHKAREMVLDATAEQARKNKEWELDMKEQGEGGSTLRNLESRVS